MEWEEKWTMRGIEKDDPRCIASKEVLTDFIERTGFLPLFRNEIPGFSVEENVCTGDWWTDDEEKDPWIWRMSLAETGRFAYGKFFNGCAGFVSKEWFPYFACIRRNGYDFDDRADEGQGHRHHDGAGAGAVRLGLAQPADPLHGAVHEGARLHPHGLVLRRGNGSDRCDRDPALHAHLVAFELHERHVERHRL